MSDYPSSSLAYPLLNQLLDPLLPFPVSSTSSTFTLSTMDTSLSVASSSDTSLSVASSSSSSSSVSSTPTIQPPSSSLVTTTTLQPPLSSLATTTPSPNSRDFSTSTSNFVANLHYSPAPSRCSRNFSKSSTIFSCPTIDARSSNQKTTAPKTSTALKWKRSTCPSTGPHSGLQTETFTIYQRTQNVRKTFR